MQAPFTLQGMSAPQPTSSDAPSQSRKRSKAAWWLLGGIVVVVIGVSSFYTFRHQSELARGRAEWDAEVARVRESGDPLTGAELDAFYRIPEGEEDLTADYVSALA